MIIKKININFANHILQYPPKLIFPFIILNQWLLTT